MKTFLRQWRRAGIVAFTYLDDIILLGATKKLLLSQRRIVVQAHPFLQQTLHVCYFDGHVCSVRRECHIGCTQAKIIARNKRGLQKEMGHGCVVYACIHQLLRPHGHTLCNVMIIYCRVQACSLSSGA